MARAFLSLRRMSAGRHAIVENDYEDVGIIVRSNSEWLWNVGKSSHVGGNIEGCHDGYARTLADCLAAAQAAVDAEDDTPVLTDEWIGAFFAPTDAERAAGLA